MQGSTFEPATSSCKLPKALGPTPNSCLDPRSSITLLKAIKHTPTNTFLCAGYLFLLHQVWLLQIWEGPLPEGMLYKKCLAAAHFFAVQSIYNEWQKVIMSVLAEPYYFHVFARVIHAIHTGMQWIALYALDTPPQTHVYVYLMSNGVLRTKLDTFQGGLCQALITKEGGTSGQCQNASHEPSHILCLEHAQVLYMEGVLSTVEGGSFHAGFVTMNTPAMLRSPAAICAYQLQSDIHQSDVIYGYTWDDNVFPFNPFNVPYPGATPKMRTKPVSGQDDTDANNGTRTKEDNTIASNGTDDDLSEKARHFVHGFRTGLRAQTRKVAGPSTLNIPPRVIYPVSPAEDINILAGEATYEVLMPHSITPLHGFGPNAVSLVKKSVYMKFATLEVEIGDKVFVW